MIGHNCKTCRKLIDSSKNFMKDSLQEFEDELLSVGKDNEDGFLVLEIDDFRKIAGRFLLEEYKKGVEDEIICVNTSGEHKDLQNLIK